MSDLEPQPIAVMPKGEQRSILYHGLLVFAFTGALTIMAAAKTGAAGGYVPSDAVAVPYMLTVIFLATLLLILALKTIKRPAVFEILFTLAMLSGAWFLADMYLPPGLALVAGSLVILLRFVWKSVLAMNLSLIAGIAGVSASIAAGLSPNAVVILLTVLSFYDIVAVYRTRHMVRMFRDLTSRGVVFAFVLTPFRFRDLAAPVVGERASKQGMLLGTGDIALPAMLAAAAFRVGPVPAVASFAGAMAGFAAMYMLYLSQPSVSGGKRAPMPALPPIALGAVLGYLLSLFIASA